MGEQNLEPELEAATILCVDDEEYVLAAVRRVLVELPGCTVLTAKDGEQALRVLERQACDLLILDLRMPGMNGIELLGRALAIAPGADSMILSASDDTQSVVQAMRAGASDYLTKPFDNQRLATTVANLLEKRRLREQNRYLRKALRDRGTRPFVGRSPAARRVLRLVEQAGQVHSNILILGESGTGKEVVARNVHSFGRHAAEPFVAIDCTAISPNLFESELFGHVRGAFTGAYESNEGLLRSAAGGSVFFDEVTEIPLTLQAKLLRAIQEREIKPVGSTQTHSFAARVLAATNRDPKASIAAGLFREDLFYRIGVIVIEIPPLRERREDIPLLVQHFIRKNDPTRTISEAAMRALQRYDWPGNVRELENWVERACALGVGSELGLQDLPFPVTHGGPSEAPSGEGLDLSSRREDAERQAILEALERAGGSRGKAAELLGMGRSTLYRKLAQLGIDPKPRR